MSAEFWHVMLLPLLACFILTGMHAYLGFHVIERQVIFVDLALAQVAALGAGTAVVLGHGFDSPTAYWLSLGCTVLGALIFSLTRFRKQRIPQEAIIGITYAVSAALLILVFSRLGEGDEHIRQALTGNILLVNKQELARMSLVYAAIGLMHGLFHRQFLQISRNLPEAFRQGLNVRFWDFLFYVSFGVVVTSSVRLAGVLLVFSFLMVPPVCAMLFSDSLKVRLALGWAAGMVASLAGMLVSYSLDLPTGASVVCVFGLMLVFFAGIRVFIPGKGLHV